MSRLLFLVLSTCPLGALAAEGQRLVVDPSEYPEARCSDGSAPVIYYAQASDPFSNQWLIFLEGGGHCYTAEDCQARWEIKPGNMGTGCDGTTCEGQGVAEAVARTRAFQGLLDDSPDPSFIDFNRVFVEYCSSDNWIGSGGSVGVPGFPNLTNPGVVEFNGHHIFMAVVDMLHRPFEGGPGIGDPGAEVLLGGGSAGSTGAQRNLDRLADALPEAAVVRGIFDAAFHGGDYPDLDTMTCSSRLAVGEVRTRPSRTMLDKWAVYAPELDQSCMAGAAAAGHDPALCLSIDYVLHGDYLDTPYFVYQSQKDWKAADGISAVGLQAIGYGTDDDERQRCLSDQVRAFIPAAAAASTALQGWYIPCSDWHTVVHRERFSDDVITSSGSDYTLPHALYNWVRGEGVRQLLDDECR